MAKASATADPKARLARLRDVEEYLLRAMPFVLLFHNTWAYLQKPYVRGLPGNLNETHPWKYVWIDTSWQPEVKQQSP